MGSDAKELSHSIRDIYTTYTPHIYHGYVSMVSREADISFLLFMHSGKRHRS